MPLASNENIITAFKRLRFAFSFSISSQFEVSAVIQHSKLSLCFLAHFSLLLGAQWCLCSIRYRYRYVREWRGHLRVRRAHSLFDWTKKSAWVYFFFFAPLTLASRGPTDAREGYRLGRTRASCHDAHTALSKSTVAIWMCKVWPATLPPF